MKMLDLPLPQWIEKDEVLDWVEGYAPDLLVGYYAQPGKFANGERTHGKGGYGQPRDNPANRLGCRTYWL